METRGTIPLVVVILLVLTAGTYLAAGVYVYQAGAVWVSVTPKRPGEQRVRLVVPSAAVTPLLNFIPEEQLRGNSRDLQRWMPAVRAAAHGLSRAPDGVLVEVLNADETVRIEKHNDALVVFCDNPSETVHVTVPLWLVENAAEKIEAKARPL